MHFASCSCTSSRTGAPIGLLNASFPFPVLQGTVRRKKKVIHRTATTDDKKLQNTLKKLTVNPIPGIEEVCL